MVVCTGHPLRMQSRVQKGEHGSEEAQGKVASNEAFLTKISLSQGLHDIVRKNSPVTVTQSLA